MRETIFRGKDIYSGEWIYGGYAPYPHGRFPCKPTIYVVERGLWKPVEIKPESLGQYTGLQDEDGRGIFEGDIVRYTDGEQSVVAEVVFYCGAFGIAKKSYLSLCFPNACNNDNYMSLWEIMWNQDETDYECAYVLKVIGNIHDSPELLEV